MCERRTIIVTPDLNIANNNSNNNLFNNNNNIINNNNNNLFKLIRFYFKLILIRMIKL